MQKTPATGVLFGMLTVLSFAQGTGGLGAGLGGRLPGGTPSVGDFSPFEGFNPYGVSANTPGGERIPEFSRGGTEIFQDILQGKTLPQGFGTDQTGVPPAAAAKVIANYDSWTLMLVTGDYYTSPDHADDLMLLYNKFKLFGDADLDARHLAVWFWKQLPKEPPEVEKEVPGRPDSERSRAFCKLFGLDDKAGPWLVVTSTYPSERVLPGWGIIRTLTLDAEIKKTLKGASAYGIASVLDEFRKNINLNNIGQYKTGTSEWWAGLNAAFDKAIEVITKVDASVLSIR